MKPKLDLEDAYNLNTPENHASYYDEMAHSYDEEFVNEHKYIYPRLVGEHFLKYSNSDDQPIADLGCGTGLVAELFTGSDMIIDGFDISPAMIHKAKDKNIYRNLQIADLTRPITNSLRKYNGLVSCGTFTLGHLGPQALNFCLMLAKPNAFCVIGINSLHYHNEGFKDFFDKFWQRGQISKPNITKVPIYEGKVGNDPIVIGNLVDFRSL